jgi:hypothetical protein
VNSKGGNSPKNFAKFCFSIGDWNLRLIAKASWCPGSLQANVDCIGSFACSDNGAEITVRASLRLPLDIAQHRVICRFLPLHGRGVPPSLPEQELMTFAEELDWHGPRDSPHEIMFRLGLTGTHLCLIVR